MALNISTMFPTSLNKMALLKEIMSIRHSNIFLEKIALKINALFHTTLTKTTLLKKELDIERHH
jgi:hypothetical protein